MKLALLIDELAMQAGVSSDILRTELSCYCNHGECSATELAFILEMYMKTGDEVSVRSILLFVQDHSERILQELRLCNKHKQLTLNNEQWWEGALKPQLGNDI